MKFFSVALLFLIFITINPCSTALAANQVQPPLVLPQQPQAQQPLQQQKTPQLEDIIGPVLIEDPFPVMYVIITIATILVLLLVSFFVWKKLHKKKPVQINLANHILKELDLHKNNFSTHKNEQVYITEVTNALRHYIEQRFHLQPARQTTREFLHSISQPSAIPDVDRDLVQNKEQIGEWLILSDNVKFAHKPLKPEEFEGFDRAIRNFIQKTTRTNQEEEK